jgi:hypothetical protein
MGAFDHGSFDPAGDARRRRVMLALVILAALFGAALGILNPGGAQ